MINSNKKDQPEKALQTSKEQIPCRSCGKPYNNYRDRKRHEIAQHMDMLNAFDCEQPGHHHMNRASQLWCIRRFNKGMPTHLQIEKPPLPSTSHALETASTNSSAST